MKHSILSVFFTFLILTVLVSGCAPASTPATTPVLPTIFTTSPIPPTYTLDPSATFTPSPTATPNNRSRWDGMEMVFIPAGEFLMGVTQKDQDLLFSMCPACPHDLFMDAHQKTVNLEGFWIDKTEVSEAQFSRFAYFKSYETTVEKQRWSYVFNPDNNKMNKVIDAYWQEPAGLLRRVSIGDSKLPVTQVSWEDAQAYCSWVEKRLPTEAEWEKAARGTDGRLFPWGNSTPNRQLVNFNVNNRGAEPVGSHPEGASPYGVQDMAGNVWEWTSTPYSGLDLFVRRGGSWGTMEEAELAMLSSAFSTSNTRAYASDLLGFRCVSDTAP